MAIIILWLVLGDAKDDHDRRRFKDNPELKTDHLSHFQQMQDGDDFDLPESEFLSPENRSELLNDPNQVPYTIGEQQDDSSYDSERSLTVEEIQVLRGHEDWIYCLDFTHDGQLLASGGADGNLILWDMATGQKKHVIKVNEAGVESVAFSNDGEFFATGGADGEVKIWSLEELKEVRSFGGAAYGISRVMFSANKKYLATHAGTALRLWDLETLRKIHTRSKHESNVKSICLSPDGVLIALGGTEGTIELWDLVQDKERDSLMGSLRAGAVVDLAFSPDGLSLASSSGNKSIYIWDLASGRPTASIRGKGSGTYNMKFSPDGRNLATWGKSTEIELWDSEYGNVICVLNGHTNWVLNLAFAPHGRIMASCGRDNVIRIWGINALPEDITPLQAAAVAEDELIEEEPTGDEEESPIEF